MDRNHLTTTVTCPMCGHVDALLRHELNRLAEHPEEQEALHSAGLETELPDAEERQQESVSDNHRCRRCGEPLPVPARERAAQTRRNGEHIVATAILVALGVAFVLGLLYLGTW